MHVPFTATSVRKQTDTPDGAAYCEIELATEEKTLLALPPIRRIVPTTITRITASMTAYSAMSCASSSRQNLKRACFILPPAMGQAENYRPAAFFRVTQIPEELSGFK